jgi:polyisoprenoid-binding protein YceI
MNIYDQQLLLSTYICTKFLKMKTIYTLSLAASLAFLASCGESTTAVESQPEATPAVAEETSTTYYMDLENSVVKWAGTKVTGGGHQGTIGIGKGAFTIEEGNITSGQISLDMKSIKNEDLAGTEKATQLEGHLSSADFFDVEQYPRASFVVTGHENGQLSGNLTLKGVTREITFPITVTEKDGTATANGSVVIDRTQWNVLHGSSLADATLGDNMEISFRLIAAPQE